MSLDNGCFLFNTDTHTETPDTYLLFVISTKVIKKMLHFLKKIYLMFL